MKLNMYIIASKLEDKIEKRIIKSDLLDCRLESALVYGFGYELSYEYLYIITSEEFDALDDEYKKGRSFICIGKSNDKKERAICDVIFVSKTVSQFAYQKEINDIFIFFNHWELKMLTLLNKDASQKALGAASLDVFENPIALYTPSLRNIFGCENDKPRPLKVFPQEEAGKYLNDDEILELKLDHEFIDSIDAVGPTMFSSNVFGYRILFINIRISGTYIARLTLLEIDRTLRQADYSLLQYFSEFIILAIQKQDLSLNNHPQGFDEMLENLLDKNNLETDYLNAVLLRYGWKQYDTYFCCLIHASDTDKMAHTVTTVCSKLESSVSGSCVYLFNKCIVMVVNISVFNSTRTKALSQLIYILREGLLKAGVSMEFSDFSKLPYYYEQAKSAINIGSETAQTIWCYRYEDFALKRLLIRAVNGDSCVEALCPEGLLRLLDYDMKNRRSYTNVLRVYLENDMSIVDTIKALYMHRATFLYQLKRIKEISNIDFDNSDMRLHLRICFKLLDMEHEKTKRIEMD